MADIGGTAASRTIFQVEDYETQVGDVPGSGEFTEIQCDHNQLDYDSAVAIAEQRTFCNTQKDYDTENGSISGQGLFSGAVGRAYRLLKKAQRAKKKIAYKYGPEGNTVGGEYGLSGIMIVGRVRIGAQVGNLQAITWEAGIDGLDQEFTWPVP